LYDEDNSLGRKSHCFFSMLTQDPHTSVATSVAIESTELEVVPYPPYSPDLALSAFSLLAALKKHLK
jgi:hypothetical protein